MKERPILFSGPMVRAILDGRKTQTRREVKPQPEWVNTEPVGQVVRVGRSAGMAHVLCPYGQTGDRLWVRETFKAISSGEVKNGYGEVRYGFAYQADGASIWQERPTIIHDMTGQPPTGPMQFKPVPWKPSIHMPRRASRITLEITGVRIERLNDISWKDAAAEGVTFSGLGAGVPLRGDIGRQNIDGFRYLWESINGAGSWDANPWVWVIEFRRVFR